MVEERLTSYEDVRSWHQTVRAEEMKLLSVPCANHEIWFELEYETLFVSFVPGVQHPKKQRSAGRRYREKAHRRSRDPLHSWIPNRSTRRYPDPTSRVVTCVDVSP